MLSGQQEQGCILEPSERPRHERPMAGTVRQPVPINDARQRALPAGRPIQLLWVRAAANKLLLELRGCRPSQGVKHPELSVLGQLD